MTALLEVEIEYCSWEAETAPVIVNDNDKEWLTKRFRCKYDAEKPCFDFKLDEKTGVSKFQKVNASGQIIIDATEATRLSDLGIKFTVHQFKGTIPYRLPGQTGGAESLHIHLPNYDLNSFNEVMVLNDICTDELQKELDNGWRILAVCPPQNARRPDYVLGRYKGAR
jgi:hypothetical protein